MLSTDANPAEKLPQDSKTFDLGNNNGSHSYTPPPSYTVQTFNFNKK